MNKLPGNEIKTLLGQLSGWDVQDGKLYKEFTFADFVTAFRFMSELAVKAEELGHHPEWTNVYNKVQISLVTHDAGGITTRDFAFAQAADNTARTLQ